MAERLHRVLKQLIDDDGIPVSVLAKLTGVSGSLFYGWTASVEGLSTAKVHYLWALAARLAEEYSNYRLIQILLPTGARISLGDDLPSPNGNCDDEHIDAGLATAKAVLGHRGKDPEAIEASALELRDVAKRLEQEAAVLRQTTGG